ncbi:hypothetical protein [Streptomyces sp. SP18CS02]|uniref:hypothetical protein n=1 Tax=Streptomyces sp. SP18CS02 TaxID=3002531 RepID=UPI002E76A7EC|nr:hypothetical protein [Streptomyces sp. SP18CS02]MEE1753786.1 hypothetical protein [Streptomyces sp. SP18CS02]
MIEKLLTAVAAAGAAAVVLGASAPMAAAVGDRHVSTSNGNGSVQSYGNTSAGDVTSTDASGTEFVGQALGVLHGAR